ncbi:MAG: GNAT family N-acetyltransferase [Cellulomonadaceae bacterium]|nr:GNAT family N-acetyltransferase [Cellulomonadaceae bacterium]
MLDCEASPVLPTVRLVEPGEIDRNELLALYESVGWTAYLRNPDDVVQAIAGSHRIAAAFDDSAPSLSAGAGRLVGTARTISDGVTVCYLLNVVVHPNYQRRGLGRAMIELLWAEYPPERLRLRVLVTDAEPRQRAFYESLGLTEAHDNNPPLRCFAKLT